MPIPLRQGLKHDTAGAGDMGVAVEMPIPLRQGLKRKKTYTHTSHRQFKQYKKGQNVPMTEDEFKALPVELQKAFKKVERPKIKEPETVKEDLKEPEPVKEAPKEPETVKEESKEPEPVKEESKEPETVKEESKPVKPKTTKKAKT